MKCGLLIILAKAVAALTVVDAFVPRAETTARSWMDPRDNGPASFPTEMRMGLFDAFHGSGSGGSKEALDEQWEIQQEILRARRGETGRLVKKRGAAPKSSPAKKKTVQFKSAKTGANVNVDVDNAAHHDHHHSNKPKFFWEH